MKTSDKTIDDLNKKAQETPTIPEKLPILPLRDIVIFPYMIYPVLIGRESSLKAVAEAIEAEKFIFLASQTATTVEEPTQNDIYHYGTVAKIVQIVRLPNNLMKILVDGAVQGRIKKFHSSTDFMSADIELNSSPSFDEQDKEFQALMRHVSDLFHQYTKINQNIAPQTVMAFDNLNDPIRKPYFAAANIQQNVQTKQRIIEKFSLNEQYFELASILTAEIEVLKIGDDIDARVHESIQKTQKRFYIQEQMRALQNELGEDEEASPELTKIKKKIDAAGMSDEVKAKALEEFDKLKKTPFLSPEFGVIRNYLDWLTDVPWQTSTDDNLDIFHVREILDEDHYGLDKAKDRIIEYIAVLNLVRKMQGQVLCFVGPPGVGKTSLGRSISRALGRKFIRMSLGGVRDEAEIRGHRKTYIGSMPGKIIQSMKRAGTVNPVILLDEVDKMAMDFRGDPSSALLEVLDPEQNYTFNDHYLEVDYDLSKVLFITTANVRYDIPLPLLDRMEVIEINSYLEHEKLGIAKRHILPKQLEKQGLTDFNVQFTDDALLTLINEYTRESGVRNCERQIANVLRKAARKIVGDILVEETKIRSKSKKTDADALSAMHEKARNIIKKRTIIITTELVHEFLKVPPFRKRDNELSDKVGVVTGLAWTSVGGDILPVEVTIMPGKEQLTLTGKLGDVMKESGMAALSFVRANATALGIPDNFYKDREIHLHVPEGAIPKDGPSAGITMAIALISAASGKAVRGDIAMTGEITLRGNILAIGGLNEKLLAAKRAGKKTVLIPKENLPDLLDMSPEIKNGLEIIPIAHVFDALPIALR